MGGVDVLQQGETQFVHHRLQLLMVRVRQQAPAGSRGECEQEVQVQRHRLKGGDDQSGLRGVYFN